AARGEATLVFRELVDRAYLLRSEFVWGLPVATLVTLFLFVGATGKSAQIPLYVWLPDAMAGPTPVSALIHAATMVTAGVYMIARPNFLLAMAPTTLHVVVFIGASPAISAPSIPPLAGFFSNDEILWQAFSHGRTALWATGVLVAGLTAFYMFRQVFMVFFGTCRADLETRHHLHESPSVMTIPLWILMGGSILAGLLWLPFDLFTPFEHWLAPVMAHHGGA